MSTKNSILILESYQEYLNDTKNSQELNMIQFAHWIIDKDMKKQFNPATTQPSEFITNNLDEEISRLLVLMYRYAKFHLKNYLVDFPELIQEDFTYLFALKRDGNLTKKELIEINVHEKTSGLEIIRRLINHGLIDESVDSKDKRSKRLAITEKGELVFREIKSVTHKIAQLICGKLNTKEKEQLYSILRKLDVFHQPIFRHKHRMELNDILETISRVG